MYEQSNNKKVGFRLLSGGVGARWARKINFLSNKCQNQFPFYFLCFVDFVINLVTVIFATLNKIGHNSQSVSVAPVMQKCLNESTVNFA